VVLSVNVEQLQTVRPNSCDVSAAVRHHTLVSTMDSIRYSKGKQRSCNITNIFSIKITFSCMDTKGSLC